MKIILISIILFFVMFIYSGFICFSLKETNTVEQQIIDKTQDPELPSSAGVDDSATPPPPPITTN